MPADLLNLSITHPDMKVSARAQPRFYKSDILFRFIRFPMNNYFIFILHLTTRVPFREIYLTRSTGIPQLSDRPQYFTLSYWSLREPIARHHASPSIHSRPIRCAGVQQVPPLLIHVSYNIKYITLINCYKNIV